MWLKKEPIIYILNPELVEGFPFMRDKTLKTSEVGIIFSIYFNGGSCTSKDLKARGCQFPVLYRLCKQGYIGIIENNKITNVLQLRKKAHEMSTLRQGDKYSD